MKDAEDLPFESRRHPARATMWDLIGAMIAVAAAVIMAALTT